MNPVITASALHKRYDDLVAVDDVSITVERGQIFGIVGPNGAGKTTTVEMAQGLRRPDRGTVRLLGVDPAARPREVRQRVGTQLQQAVLPDRMTVREALWLYGSYYDRSVPADELLATWDLLDKQHAPFDTLSGGQRQRLFIALALVGRPEVVFLDELTTGLDPAARRATWDHVRRIRDSGVTVVLVTHFMDEAERLCDRIAVIDGGRVVAEGTPDELIAAAVGERVVTFGAPAGFRVEWLDARPGVRSVEVLDGDAGAQVVVEGDRDVLFEITTGLAAHGARPDDLDVTRTSLEDAFLVLTGAEGPDQADHHPATADTTAH